MISIPSARPRLAVRARAARFKRGWYFRQEKRERRLSRLMAMLVMSSFAVSLVLATALPVFGISSTQLESLPDPRELGLGTVPQDTLVYARDGKTLIADLHPGGYYRYQVPLNAISPTLQHATIAIEDANFYKDPGIDFGGTLRAALTDWRSKSAVQGGSTITQQLVKIRLVGSQTSIERKLKEAVLAYQVSQLYSKGQILEMYLNQVYYGNQSYGIEAASENYFHKHASELDLAQASMLAGIPQNPSYNNPYANWDGARVRQHQVLDAMVRTSYITPEEADQAYAEDISPPTHMFTPSDAVQYPDFLGYVISQIRSQFGADATTGGGLRVTTTLDPNLENIAERDVTDGIHTASRYRASNGAAVAIDPRTGEVLALVGAVPGAPGGDFNMALWPPRNPGSSMKIFTYTAGIASGKYTMTSPIADAPYCVGGYCPQNYEHSYIGVCQLQVCMGNSRNVPAVKVEMGVGVDRVADLARQMGAPPYVSHTDDQGFQHYTSDDPLSAFYPPLTLGSYGETPLQMATAASVLGAQGVLHQPTALLQVSDAAGHPIYKHDPAQGAKQVLDPKVAFIMEQIMSDNSNRVRIFGPNSPLILPDRKVAAKTGTSDDFGDAWTVGYTPSIAVALWVGNTDWRQKMTNDSVFVAAPTWHNLMEDELNAMGRPKGEWFGEPPGLGHANVNGKEAWYMPGTGPQTNGPIH